ncbi:MAG: redox-regulated ATPase YchF [Candidatus Manganitrophaceae bacterium]
MSVNCGIIGLPNVGKSTLFNALTAASAAVANYPFCTVEPNVGIVEVPDERVVRLAEIYRPKKRTSTHMEFVDIAGLVAGASRGEGLGNQFLAHIREVDALVHVVRCFDDPEIVHVAGAVDPRRDVEIIDTELILKDLDTVEKRLIRGEKKAKSGEKESVREVALLTRLKDHLSGGHSARRFPFSEEDGLIRKELTLLTGKPILYVANVPEGDIEKGNHYSERVAEIAQSEGTECVVISGKIESEIASLSQEEAVLFLRDLGLSEPGLARLIRASYRLLGLMTFFTVGEDEVKAWTIRNGTPAVEAAGEIHSDIKRGFIRAEIFSYADLIRLGSAQAIKEKGLLRLEGKEYVVQDGDCVYFRFNV